MTISRALIALLAVILTAHLVVAEFRISSTKRYTKQILSFGSRTPGQPGHHLAKEYLRKTLGAIPGWKAQQTQRLQPHIDRLNTNLKMENIVVNFKLPNANAANADKELVLACHYDSKYFKEGEFLGATDSAVPCAMLITLANEISKRSKVYAMLNNKANVGSVTLVFFDGEEAFGEWSNTDSKYGSKALAREWESSKKLEKISLFVLLDLIGAENPVFHNYPVHKGNATIPRTNTEALYASLVKIERALYKKSNDKNAKPMFEEAQIWAQPVDDDHVPFAHRAVPVLHLIPSPFPKVWHTLQDNESALDWPTTKRVQQIVFKFVFNFIYPEPAVQPKH